MHLFSYCCDEFYRSAAHICKRLISSVWYICLAPMTALEIHDEQSFSPLRLRSLTCLSPQHPNLSQLPFSTIWSTAFPPPAPHPFACARRRVPTATLKANCDHHQGPLEVLLMLSSALNRTYTVSKASDVKSVKSEWCSSKDEYRKVHIYRTFILSRMVWLDAETISFCLLCGAQFIPCRGAQTSPEIEVSLRKQITWWLALWRTLMVDTILAALT